jgi:hypothetical protein
MIAGVFLAAHNGVSAVEVEQDAAQTQRLSTAGVVCPHGLSLCRRGRVGPGSCFDGKKYFCDAGRLHPIHLR